MLQIIRPTTRTTRERIEPQVSPASRASPDDRGRIAAPQLLPKVEDAIAAAAILAEDDLRRETAALIEKHGFFEYFDPIDATPCGGDNFTWTAAIWLTWAGRDLEPAKGAA